MEEAARLWGQLGEGWVTSQAVSFQGGVLVLGLGSPLVQGSGPGSLREEPK